jgi:L-threonylcarbamoyladenylate synthase
MTSRRLPARRPEAGVIGPERIDLAGLTEADGAALAERIRRARLVCFPTDTVYGVGGAATAEVGAALVAAKGREPDKPLQVIFASVALLEAQVPLAPGLRAACRALLPGAVTLVVPYPPAWTFPPPAATLGVRVPAWPAAARVLAVLPFPLVASSANPSGGQAPARLDEVDPVLLARCDLALDAGPAAGVASTVIDLARYDQEGSWRVLRAGALSEAEVAARLAAAARGPSR